MKPVDLSYSTFFPAPHKTSVLTAEWAKEIEKRTNGRVKVTTHYGGTLTPADKCYDGVVRGISDIGTAPLAYTRGRFPLTEVTDLPIGCESALAGTKMANEYYKKFRPKEIDEVKVMYLMTHRPGLIHTKKPVYKLEELKGMKIRAFGAVTKIVTALGGAPVSMPMGETYEALSRGVVEGSIAPYEALEGGKWGEVVKYSTEAWGMSYIGTFFVVMNKDRWNSLSADIQNIIEKVNEEWIEKHGRAWDEIDKSGKDFTIKLGNKIISLLKEEHKRWANAVRPILDDYVNNMKAKGLPGEEALKFCLDYLKKKQ